VKARAALLAAVLAVAPACSIETGVAVDTAKDPTCLPERLILIAQSVPSAKLIPCIAAYPAGWSFERIEVHNDRSEFSLESDRAGQAAVTVTLLPRCDTEGATLVQQNDEPSTEKYERILQAVGRYVGDRYYVFDGGCVVYRFDLDVENERLALANEATAALTFMPRTEVAAQVSDYSDGELRLD
jgi:hypothetical protein